MEDKKLSQYLKYAFFVMLGLSMLSIMFDSERLYHFAKPLIMPVLLVYFRKGLSLNLSLSFILAVFALVFAFIGDSFMMYADKKELYFLISLGAYTITLILYALSFDKAVSPQSQPQSLLVQLLYAIPFLLVGGFVFYLILENLSMMMAVVLCVYSTVLIYMVVQAIGRNGRANRDSVNQVILGAVFFMFSDVLVALDRFYQPMNNAELFIMLPYILGQWNIINGLLQHYNNSQTA